MPVIRRPRQYKVLVSLLLFSPAIFLLNIWVMNKGALAKVFQTEKLWWLGIEGAWALLAQYWLWKVYWRGFMAVLALSGVMLGMNLYLLVTSRNYALAFYGLFLLIISALYVLHLYRNLNESYYHPGQRWFEGMPRFLPRIEAELRAGQAVVPARLSKLGIEGCYAYPRESRAGIDFDKVDGIGLKLGDLSLDCAVELVSKSKDGLGSGLRFTALTADQSKDIKDFIDRVRSSGYVS